VLRFQVTAAAEVTIPPSTCHPDRSAAKWRDLQFAGL
jgi:hypothetical protein